MMPAFVDGDLALVRYQETVEPGQVGVFIKNGEGYIKELGRGALVSLNQKYKDIPLLDTDDVRCTGLVIGTARRPQWRNR
jgi:phage repressor protein C with HTH and peptisase S24 domain